jgi:hypothetical protein
VNDVPWPVNRNGRLMVSRQETARSLLTPGELDRRSATMPLAASPIFDPGDAMPGVVGEVGAYQDSRSRKGPSLATRSDVPRDAGRHQRSHLARPAVGRTRAGINWRRVRCGGARRYGAPR